MTANFIHQFWTLTLSSEVIYQVWYVINEQLLPEQKCKWHLTFSKSGMMCKQALYISVFSCFLLLIKCNGDSYDADHDHCVESCNEDRHEDLDDHCYYWSTARQFWETSKQECEGMDGHLAAVTSLRIHNFLMKRVDKKDKDTWFWIS